MDQAGGPATPVDQQTGALSERDRTVLAFEKQWWKYAGTKEQAISEIFGLSPTRYYQVLNRLIDSPDAMRSDPMLIKRLRRVRGGRRRTSSAGPWRFGSPAEAVDTDRSRR
jgi:hypothetical protein